jgi:hypothetical protein
MRDMFAPPPQIDTNLIANMPFQIAPFNLLQNFREYKKTFYGLMRGFILGLPLSLKVTIQYTLLYVGRAAGFEPG